MHLGIDFWKDFGGFWVRNGGMLAPKSMKNRCKMRIALFFGKSCCRCSGGLIFEVLGVEVWSINPSKTIKNVPKTLVFVRFRAHNGKNIVRFWPREAETAIWVTDVEFPGFSVDLHPEPSWSLLWLFFYIYQNPITGEPAIIMKKIRAWKSPGLVNSVENTSFTQTF